MLSLLWSDGYCGIQLKLSFALVLCLLSHPICTGSLLDSRARSTMLWLWFRMPIQRERSVQIQQNSSLWKVKYILYISSTLFCAVISYICYIRFGTVLWQRCANNAVQFINMRVFLQWHISLITENLMTYHSWENDQNCAVNLSLSVV